MSVISLRLKETDMKRIEELSRLEQKEKSAVARELLNYGWVFLMLKRYREGKLSLGSLAEKLNLSLSEAIDMLAEMGVESPLGVEDYLKGLDVLRSR
jgi:predicted HTH domain antitoxin